MVLNRDISEWRPQEVSKAESVRECLIDVGTSRKKWMTIFNMAMRGNYDLLMFPSLLQVEAASAPFLDTATVGASRAYKAQQFENIVDLVRLYKQPTSSSSADFWWTSSVDA